MQKITVFKVAGLVILIILITYQVIGKIIIVRHVTLRKQKYSRGIFFKRGGTLCLNNFTLKHICDMSFGTSLGKR